MKIAEVAGGVATTLRIKGVSEQFDPPPQVETEARLVPSGDEFLLHADERVWAVEGVTSSDQSEILSVVTSGLPTLAYVAQSRGDALVLESRRFTQDLRITDPMQFGLDEKVLEDIRKGHRVGGTVADVAAWLEDRLFIPPSPEGPAELRRLVISGDVRGRLDAFRVFGYRVAADVRRVDGKLRIERVVRGGRGGRNRVALLHAQVSVVDATVVAELHGAVRTTLSEAVTKNSSYLRTWQEYHRMEREFVLRRARTFGTLSYSKRERRRDGGWRFHLVQTEDLADRLALLGEGDRFELEAGGSPPDLDGEFEPTQAGRLRRRETPNLTAAIVKIEERRGIVDLVPPDEDEDQPTPPRSGFLFLSTSGDKVRLTRRERAEEALRTGNCPLPQLGLLMEGRPAPAARRGKISVRSKKLWGVVRDVFGDARPTQRQLEAIERALNTPDMCLIQGPPGTGKTKVITAIERCLAVLADEGVELSHRILATAAQHDAVENVVQRTEVFGLPAVKVGRRRRDSDTKIDPVQVFIDERVEKLRSHIGAPPEAERLSKARALTVACFRARSLPAEQAARILEIVRVLDRLTPPDLRDRALETASALRRPTRSGDPEEAALMLRAARSIRVDAGPFSDDGPIQARKALRRLDAVLEQEERGFLQRCAEREPEEPPEWLEEGRPLREAIIDRLTQVPSVSELRIDDDTQLLLLEILDTVDRRLTSSREGDEVAISTYLTDLETDPDGVREALRHYTVVLAATLQQSAGALMRRVRGIEHGQTTFESVIVDEAARANPLDLFIPLSMAKRRVVLVGDHRQLPHLLEPDVERQLAEGVDQGTVEVQTLQAIQASLFERMWVVLRALEDQDGIRRTVTLNAQYRMHPELGRFLSENFYEFHEDEAIESPRPEEEFTHTLPGYSTSERPVAACWLDVPHDRGREIRGTSKRRPVEARVIARELRRIIDHDPTLTYGVISFYSAQVDEIGMALIETGLTEPAQNARGWRIADRWSMTLNAEGKPVERLRIGTVDAFQGKEFDVVFLSVTRSNDLPGETTEQQRRKYGHLMLENRLCVAMSRQQRLLVSVGDLEFVRAAEPLRPLRAYADLCGEPHGIVR